MAERKDKPEQSFEVEIISPAKLTKTEFRTKVKAAIDEATKEFQKTHGVPSLEVSGKASEGLFDLGASWPWVIHFGGHVLGGLLYKAGEEAAKEVGKEGGQSFYATLKGSLRLRNLTVGTPRDLRLFPDPNHPYASLPPQSPKAVIKKRKKKVKSKPKARSKAKAASRRTRTKRR
jgi:hypothetical protein